MVLGLDLRGQIAVMRFGDRATDAGQSNAVAAKINSIGARYKWLATIWRNCGAKK